MKEIDKTYSQLAAVTEQLSTMAAEEDAAAESGLALAPAEDAGPVGRTGAAARAAASLHHRPLGRRADPDLLRLAKVVVEGDEPVAVRQVQRHLLLHRLQRDKEFVIKHSNKLNIVKFISIITGSVQCPMSMWR